MRPTLLLLTLAGVLAGCEASILAAPTPVGHTLAVESEPSAEAADHPIEVEPAEEETAPDEDAAQAAWKAAEVRLLAVSARREKLAVPLKTFADTIDDWRHIGTMYNEVGVPQARCFAMGVLLGMEGLVAHLDDEGSPDLHTKTNENAHEVRVLALTHLNFAGVLEGHVGQDREELVLEWNLDCPGKHKIPVTARLQQTGTSSFYKIMNEGRVLMVLGDIEAGFADKVIAALQANPTVKTVSLGSGGGLVVEAMRAGEYIRLHGYDTVLWNGCFSACPLVFMAGNNREIWSPYPELGFHQVSRSDGSAVSLDDPVYGGITRYLVRMGIDHRLVLLNMWDSPPNEMTRIAGHDTGLCDAKVVTWIQRRCHNDSHVFPDGF